MARTSRSKDLDSLTKRNTLESGKRHLEQVQAGGYLIYERSKDGMAGNWSSRWYDPDTRKQKQKKIGVADDLTKADGISVFDYKQAKVKAQEWFKGSARLADFEVTGVAIHVGDYLVKDAIEDYLTKLEQDGKNSKGDFKAMLNKWAVPYLGDIKVTRLTRVKLEKWRTDISKMPKQGQTSIPDNEDAIRRRKDSANHVLVLVKTALYQAVKSGKADPPLAGGWHEAEYFKGVKVSRTRFLDKQESKALVEACEGDFKKLVIAGLFTGARYQELARMKKADVNIEGRTIYFGPYGKIKGKTRFVHLTDEATEWFKEQIEGKMSGDRVFTRKSYRYFKNRGDGMDGIWNDSDQTYYIKIAYKKAKISPVTFHELRHTYASGLVMAGVPLKFVAEQLGHNTTKMVEEHYGHLVPQGVGDTVRRLSPNLDIL
jgi:integrase